MTAAFTLSSGFNFHTKFGITVPESVLFLLQKIHALSPNKQDEFGIFLKATINLDAGMVYIHPVDDMKNENFILPDQEVTPGSISFKETAPDGYNTVIHRHPAGVTQFSGTDMSSINQEFDVSLVFIPPESFPDAIVNIRVSDDSFLQLRIKSTDIIIEKPKLKYTPAFKELVLSKLKQRRVVSSLPAGVTISSVDQKPPRLQFGGGNKKKSFNLPTNGFLDNLDDYDPDEDLFQELAKMDRDSQNFD